MGTMTIEHIHEDILGLKQEIEEIKSLLVEDFELAKDLREEIEKSRKRPKKEFVSQEEMKKEFGKA